MLDESYQLTGRLYTEMFHFQPFSFMLPINLQSLIHIEYY